MTLAEINPTIHNSIPLLVVLTGPTAVGKTAVSVELADYFNSEIISADSRQFFKEMRIGTAVPSQAELNLVPHHFIGTHSIIENYNVYQFESDAVQKIVELFTTKPVVFLAGGSGLYIRAICDGIDVLPDPDPELRITLTQEYQQLGLEILQQKLKILDPGYYNIVDKKNPARIIRALEVCIQTGKTFTSFRTSKIRRRPFRILKIALSLCRSDLVERIDKRVDIMCNSGLFDEAIELIPFRNYQALNTVGYKEIFEFYDRKVTEDQAIENIRVNTRRYAKKQMTWLRSEQDYYWFHPQQLDALKRLITYSL